MRGIATLLALLLSVGVLHGKVTLRFSTWHPPASREVRTVWIPMLEKLKEMSKGEIDYQLFAGGALGKGPEHYDIVRDGLSDMGYFTATWTPGRFPLSDVLSLPAWFDGKDISTEVGNAVYRRVLWREFPDVEVMELNPCIQSFFWTKHPIRSLGELEGMRIRTPGGMQTRVIKALGAEPVFMPLGDVYLALEMGTIDGVVTCPPLVLAYKLYEVADNCLLVTMGCVTEGVVANKSFWASLPDDLKALIRQVASNPYRATGGLTRAVYAQMIEELEGKGVRFHRLPEGEVPLWKERVQGVTREWVRELEAKGLPAGEAVRAFAEECRKRGIECVACPPELR